MSTSIEESIEYFVECGLSRNNAEITLGLIYVFVSMPMMLAFLYFIYRKIKKLVIKLFKKYKNNNPQ